MIRKIVFKPSRVLAIVIVVLFVVVLIGYFLETSGPAARYGAKMVFDPIGKRTILFGGRAEGLLGLKYFNDLWVFDYAAQTWTLLKTALRPPGRLAPGMVYDPDRHQLILFGGDTNAERLNDTWVYTLADHRWQEVHPTNSPPPRSDMGLVYDEAHHVAILFGGYCQDEVRDACDDTWVYDPAMNTWTEMEPPSSPPIIYGQAMMYDAANQHIILWGGHMSAYRDGQPASLGYDDRIWRYDYADNTWEERRHAYRPPARYWHQAVLATPRGAILLFGGHGHQSHLNDTWALDMGNDTWRKIDSAPAPSPRVNPAMVYDPVHQVVILFGGVTDDFDDLGDTWIFKPADASGQWTQMPLR